MAGAPILYQWDGESMVPFGRFAREADAQFVVGERYRMAVVEDRSAVSHRHYFACVNDAWANLPEQYEGRWPTAEHLRKWALCKAGYCDERTIVTASKAEAQRVAAFIRPMDGYAIVTVSGPVVTVYTARSQDTRSMDRKTFQESKDAVLGILEGLLQVPEGTLITQSARAA